MSSINGIPAFSAESLQAINSAIAVAGAMGHTFVGSEHLLCGLARTNKCAAAVLLSRQRIYADDLLLRLKALHGVGKPVRLSEGDLSPRAKKQLQGARTLASSRSESRTGTEHILMSILSDRECTACSIIGEYGAGVTGRLFSEANVRSFVEPSFDAKDTKVEDSRKKGGTPMLSKYARELTAAARQGRLDPVIGRESEIERMVQILLRRTKNNPCLIGEAGVGKTAVVEGFAQRIAEGRVPSELMDRRVYSLDISAMLAGAKYRGDFEERVKGVLDEVSDRKDMILFIDEIHMIVGTGAAEGAIDAAGILKPQLARGNICLIGATTTDEYRRSIEKDAALERRFQPVRVEQPDEASTLEILRGLRSTLEQHHHSVITDEALKAAVRLSVRYMCDRNLPDKAIDLIDEAAARARTKEPSLTTNTSSAMRESAITKALLRKDYDTVATLSRTSQVYSPRITVDEEQVAQAVSAVTGIPAARLTEDEGARLCDLEERLRERVIGQDEAVDLVAKAVRRGRAGLKDPDRPVGSFLFLGQTGVGKTELARALAEAVFGDKKRLIRFDMSEYMERHSVSKLIGSPPGYVGYEEQGQLIKQVRTAPYSVVLFDEVEKAHPDVLNILLQILEDGSVTAADGRKADFRSAIVILTGNIGAQELSRRSVGFAGTKGGESDVMGALKKQFRPELLNRIDNVVVFRRLEMQDMERICMVMLESVRKRAAARGIELSFSAEAVRRLCEGVQTEDMGARPLRRRITAEIEDMLSQSIISGELYESCHAVVNAEKEGFSVAVDV